MKFTVGPAGGNVFPAVAASFLRYSSEGKPSDFILVVDAYRVIRQISRHAI